MLNTKFLQTDASRQIDRFRPARVSLFCALLAFASGVLFAQETATTLDDLRFVVGQGDRVTVTDLSGKNIKGAVQRIAPGLLEIRTGGSLRSFSDNDVRQITRAKADSPLNGILIGAGVGFGATLPLLMAVSEGDHGWAVAGAGIWGLIGAGIGAVVDVAVREKQTVYVRTAKRASFNISPFYLNSGPKLLQDSRLRFGGTDPSKGIAVTIRF